MLHTTLGFLLFIDLIGRKFYRQLNLLLKVNILAKSQVDVIQVDEVIIFVASLLVAPTNNGWLGIRSHLIGFLLVHLSFVCFWWISWSNALSLDCILLLLSAVVSSVQSVQNCGILWDSIVESFHILLVITVFILEFIHTNPIKTKGVLVLELSSLVLLLLEQLNLLNFILLLYKRKINHIYNKYLPDQVSSTLL